MRRWIKDKQKSNFNYTTTQWDDNLKMIDIYTSVYKFT